MKMGLVEKIIFKNITLNIEIFYSIFPLVAHIQFSNSCHFVKEEEIGTQGDVVDDVTNAMNNAKIHSCFGNCLFISF